MSEPYPPSVLYLDRLKAVAITDLRLETHHRGKVLFARVWGGSERLQAFQTAIEDEHGTAERLSVFHIHPATPVTQVLPHDAAFAIKEPYLKLAGDSGTMIRVDHPSDPMILDRFDGHVPACWRTSMTPSAAECKDSGNETYLAKHYVTAAKHYATGVDLCGDDEEDIRRDLHRNLAITNIHLKRFDFARSHALAALIPDAADEKSRKSNEKAYYRAGRAA